MSQIDKITLCYFLNISIYSESIKKYHQLTSQKHFKIGTKISSGFPATLLPCFSQKGSPTLHDHFGSLTCAFLGCAQATEPLQVLCWSISSSVSAHMAVAVPSAVSSSHLSLWYVWAGHCVLPWQAEVLAGKHCSCALQSWLEPAVTVTGWFTAFSHAAHTAVPCHSNPAIYALSDKNLKHLSLIFELKNCRYHITFGNMRDLWIRYRQ